MNKNVALKLIELSALNGVAFLEMTEKWQKQCTKDMTKNILESMVSKNINEIEMAAIVSTIKNRLEVDNILMVGLSFAVMMSFEEDIIKDFLIAINNMIKIRKEQFKIINPEIAESVEKSSREFDKKVKVIIKLMEELEKTKGDGENKITVIANSSKFIN